MTWTAIPWMSAKMFQAEITTDCETALRFLFETVSVRALLAGIVCQMLTVLASRIVLQSVTAWPAVSASKWVLLMAF